MLEQSWARPFIKRETCPFCSSGPSIFRRDGQVKSFFDLNVFWDTHDLTRLVTETLGPSHFQVKKCLYWRVF